MTKLFLKTGYPIPVSVSWLNLFYWVWFQVNAATTKIWLMTNFHTNECHWFLRMNR